MNKLTALLFICVLTILCACEEASPPTEAHVAYMVDFRGSVTEVRFDGKIGKDVIGRCSLSKASDDVYPYRLTFKLERHGDLQNTHELEVLSLRVRETPTVEVLACDGMRINFRGVEESSLLQCGDATTGKCEFQIVVHDKKEKRVEGTFICGEFNTNVMDPSGPVPMEIHSGTFSFTHCD